MNWGSVGEFFAMGGKGLYVWGSYGVTFAVIALEIGLLALRRRAAGREQT
jgi:heme exporter protein D